MTAAVRPLAGFLASIASPALAGLSDGALLGRYVRERDEASFAELVRRHANMVRAVAGRAGLSHADQDDCTQAAFLVLATHAERLTHDATVGDWLHGVAVRVALSARTRARRRHAHESRAARTEAVPPDRSPEYADTARAIDRAVRALPAKLRDAVILCELEGVSRPQAAARLGVPVGTLSSRLATAHQKLARRLARPLGFAALTLAAGPPPAALAHAALAAAFAPPRAVPAAVSALVSGVTHMMWFSKLKLVAACGVAALAVGAAGVGVGVRATADEPAGKGTPPVRGMVPPLPAPPLSPERSRRVEAAEAEVRRLAGTWLITSFTRDGEPLRWSEDGHGAWVFSSDGKFDHVQVKDGRATAKPRFERITGAGATAPREQARFRANSFRTPHELDIANAVDAPGRWPVESFIYELADDTLRVACYFGGPLDPDRPLGFSVHGKPAGSPPLLVMALKREKPAAK